MPRLWRALDKESLHSYSYLQTHTHTHTHWLIPIKVLFKNIGLHDSIFLSVLVLREPRTIGAMRLLEVRPEHQNTKTCQESTGARISPVKLNAMLFETRCLAPKTSAYFDIVFCNLVCCKFRCCSASSADHKIKETTFGYPTENALMCHYSVP